MSKNLLNEPCRQDAEGTCQHITEDGTALWIIPSGTHYFFGHTVSGTGPLGSAATASQKDDVAKDLVRILAKHAGDGEGTIYPANIKDVLVDLSIFIVNRDTKVLEHGRRLGQMEVGNGQA